MSGVIMLTLAGLRKNKRQMISQIVIILIAALLLNVGLLTAFRFGNYFDEKAIELNAAHIAFAYMNHNYNEKFLHFVQQHENTVEVQLDDIFIMRGILKMPAATLDMGQAVIGFNYDDMGMMTRVNLIGEHLPTNENSIYVPYLLKFMGGVELGSVFTISVDEEIYDKSKVKDYEFIVAGFTEGLMLSDTNTGGISVHLPEEAYAKFIQQIPDFYRGIIISAQLTDVSLSPDMMDEYDNHFDGESGISWGIALPIVKMIKSIMSNIIAALLMGFSLIVLIVSLIVIRFRVTNTIEEQMRNYGALKAIGYTSRQIIIAVSLQFLSITAVASCVGIALSFGVINAVSMMLSMQTGLIWIQGFDPLISTISLLFILTATAITALMSAGVLKKTPPITALRGNTESILLRNIMPLESTAMPLGVSLSMKTTFLNIKQNILIVIILASITFVVAFGVVMGYAASSDTFINLFSGQYSDVAVYVSPNEDANEILEEILREDGVIRAASVGDWRSVIFDEQWLSITAIMDDFSEIFIDQAYTGRYPEHTHEILIGGSYAAEKGLHIGDTVYLSSGERREPYIITGFIQSGNNMGRESFITVDGYRLLDPDYRISSFFIQLDKDMDIDAFISDMNQRYGDKILDVLNMREMVAMQGAAILAMVDIIIIAFNIIAVLVIIFILFLVVKTLVLRRKKELGIQKALGFTTFQLMNQIAGSFVPVALVGVSIGSVVGCMTMNYFLQLLFRSIGIMKVDFDIPIALILMASALICLLVYTVSIIVSLRIKNISAFALITE